MNIFTHCARIIFKSAVTKYFDISALNGMPENSQVRKYPNVPPCYIVCTCPVMVEFYFRRMKRDRLCGLVVRVSGYRYRGRVRFPTLPDFLSSSGSGTVSTQPREVN